MATITIPGMFLTGDHASRPAATTVGGGAVYACSTHTKLYQTDAAATTWSDYFDPTGLTGAPSTVDYLVGTASGGLSAEIAVGTTPGGELGGTWASPTVDTTHSGSSHAGLSGQPGSTDVAVADGGTGASTASSARTNLGAAASGAVTGSGLTQATGKLLGRSTASTGAIEEITVGTNLTLSGGTLDATGGGSLTVDDEGTPLSTAATTLDFVGAGVTASGTGATKTITIPGGGGSQSLYGVDTSNSLHYLDKHDALDGTVGDDFTGALNTSLWTRRNITGGMETTGRASTIMQVDLTNAAAAMQYYQTQANADFDRAVKMSYRGRVDTTGFMFGIGACDNTGAGRGIVAYDDGNVYAALLASNAYSSNAGYILKTHSWLSGGWIWLRLKYDQAAHNFTVFVSTDGADWSQSIVMNVTLTITEVAFGRFFGAVNNNGFNVDWFNKVTA